ncbi:DUF992 domain-containing protein [Hyphomicrobium sp. GJ21]|uniref:DUF992 domain-containing protein n=1 Tax=Hyphomicrobium sp. GJ21 TaxID=113574 RepID=UPI001FCD1F7A|nr:DUF992 domain-containing protein [Hyphomicrobium sp. GJ21]
MSMKPSLATTSSILAAAVAVVAGASIEAKPAAAAPKITLGTLTCKGHGGVGLILGSKEQMRCVFTTAVSARRHPYMATITKIGVDIGFTGESTLVWTVLGTTVDIAEGALEGGYGGVTAGVAVGIGANANALVGGSGKSIVLQPISVEGQTGLNLSAGVAGLTLERG